MEGCDIPADLALPVSRHVLKGARPRQPRCGALTDWLAACLPACLGAAHGGTRQGAATAAGNESCQLTGQILPCFRPNEMGLVTVAYESCNCN